MEKTFDLIVLGGGPAGYNCAEYAAKNGLTVALCEKEKLGGTCLNAGCIPTKSLLYAAKMYHCAAGAGESYGVTAEHAALDHARAVEKKDEIVTALVGGVAAGLKKLKITVLTGEAEIVKAAGGFTVRCGDETISAKNLIVATGSAPAVPPICGAQEGIAAGRVLTSTELLELKKLPQKLVIVGGGVIGFEMAAYFLEAGSHVTVIEMLDKVLGPNDREVSRLIQQEMERRGMEIHLSAAVTEIAENEVRFTEGGESRAAEYDKVLLCVGRRPMSAVKGLDRTGAALCRGAIVTDDRCRTNVAGMYAIGDVNGKFTLAHVAYREGEVAVNDILGTKDQMDYSAVCGVVYTRPEVAFVGLGEEAARDAGLDVEIRRVSLNMSGRHYAENGPSRGILKLIVDKKRRIIVGAAVMSSYASEYIYAIALMIQNKLPIQSIRRTIFPHPTACEIIREALMQ